MSETDATGVTLSQDFLDGLIDGIATANRAAISHNNELRQLRHTVMFGVLFLAILYTKIGVRTWPV